MKKLSKSEIRIEIGVDENNTPEQITWRAEGPEGPQENTSKAMLLSFFDEATKDTFKIDLWTKDMQVAEMDRFFFHSLKALGETYFKATRNEKLANAFQSFVHYFGEETKIIPKDPS